MRKSIFAAAVLLLWGSSLAQNVGDQAALGYDNQRTGLNANMGDFKPPLSLIRDVTLGGVLNASGCTAFEDLLVVGEGSGAANPARYSIFNINTSGDVLTPLFSTSFLGEAEDLNYTPSFANGILLLGGPATSTVKAIDIAGFSQVWQDLDVGGSSGRHPVVTGNLAIYSGQSRIAARQASTGISLWEVDTTTASAPLALQGDRVYALESDGNLRALNIDDGSTIFSAAGIGSDDSWIIASEKYVFSSNPAAGAYGAIRVSNQMVAWSRAGGFTLARQGLALAYDRLFVFLDDNGQGQAELRVHNPDTGERLLTVVEGGPGMRFPSVVNNAVYYYAADAARVQVRDAFSGVLLESIPAPDARGMLASDGRLLVLFADRLQIWEPSGAILFPQIADGEGQSTLLTLVNLGGEEANARASFFGPDGQPLRLPVEGVVGTVSNVAFTIPPRASRRIQTANGEDLRRGWARVTADQRIRGSSLFQFSDAGVVLFEAGFGEAVPVNEALVFVQKAEVVSAAGAPVVFSTAVAFANPSNQAAQVTVSLLDGDGQEVATLQIDDFEARAQDARFVEELFPVETEGDFEGSMRIASDVPLIVASLRTIGGFQLSSLPSGQAR